MSGLTFDLSAHLQAAKSRGRRADSTEFLVNALNCYRLNFEHSYHREFVSVVPMLMSSSFDLSSTSLVFLGVLTFLTCATKADPIYLYHFCTNTSTYSPNSTFQTNLNSLLSSLSSNAVSRRNGFYNTTAGRSSPDVAYGLFLCRGDVSADVCQDCVTTATSESVRRCTKEREVVIWYDECMLRYSNRSFFSIVTEVPAISMLNSGNITEQSRFNQLLGETMNDLSRRVASGESFTPAEKFGVEQANFTAIQTLFTLAQCTPDLSESSCTRCLTGAIAGIGNCCYGKQGGRVLIPSCNVRYELYQFYNTAAIALSPPAPSPSSLVPPPSRGKDVSSQKIIAIVVPVGVSVALACAICLFFLRRKVKTKYNPVNEQNVENDITAVQSLQYDLNTIQAATNNFSAANKIGAGGFGDVYKGILSNGQEIAVKRLSRGSGQGAEEFKNEVILVAKLQHRNLARLLGFCLDGEEKILIYEFVPNKSLDYFLFDPEKRRLLDWSKRYKIIQGIVRGILYLHEDARLRIVHRDLKASNVLLDGDMHPKISDFGMARIFGVDQTQANTNRVVGTYGYMSPEYAMHGQFSVKSDVYSFGVLVLEIISGQRSTRFHQSNGAEDLVNYAWRKWREGTPLELMDPNLGDSYSRNEVLRCIHVGLLCVQEDPVDRPTMASIALVLNTFSVTLPLPREPSIFGHNKKELNPPLKGVALDQSTSSSMPGSVNEATITELHPR